jgi:hypothetical protein
MTNIEVKAFASGPMRLLGTYRDTWTFPPGTDAAALQLKVEVPPGTKYAFAVMTTSALMFGNEGAPQTGSLERVLIQTNKKDISGGSFELDLIAGLRAHGGAVPSSGVIDFEVLCFG